MQDTVKPSAAGEGGLTIVDIARELGVSKSTVSRAISGKGRISEATRQRVLDYLKANGYRASASVSRLCRARTDVIGVILPSDPNTIDTPFFLGCLVGICETAAVNGYSVQIMLEVINEEDILDDLISEHRVDGLIITRAHIDETLLNRLQEKELPFVVIGSSRRSNVIQVDNDVFASCAELTRILSASSERVAFIAGEQSHRVQKARYEGFLQGIMENDLSIDKSRVFLNMNNKTQIDQAMCQLFEMGVDCVITSDDVICGRVLNWLHNRKYMIPGDIKVASFYNSSYLAEHNPPITAINVNPKDVGVKATDVLFRLLDGQPVKQRNLINYEILLRKSTM